MNMVLCPLSIQQLQQHNNPSILNCNHFYVYKPSSIYPYINMICITITTMYWLVFVGLFAHIFIIPIIHLPLYHLRVLSFDVISYYVDHIIYHSSQKSIHN
jgi:hypothetical protein